MAPLSQGRPPPAPSLAPRSATSGAASSDSGHPPQQAQRVSAPAAPAAGLCPVCRRHLRDVFEHARKQHPEHKYTLSEALRINAYACPCGTLVRSAAQGLARHRRLTGCQAGLPPPTSLPPPRRGPRVRTSGPVAAQPRPPIAARRSSTAPVRLRARRAVVSSSDDSRSLSSSDRSPSASSSSSRQDPRESANEAQGPDPVPVPVQDQDQVQEPPAVLPGRWFLPDPFRPIAEEQADELCMHLVNFPPASRVLPASLGKKFAQAAGRLASRFCNEPTLDNLLLLLGLPSVAIAPATTRYRVRDVANRLSQYPDVPLPDSYPDGNERRDRSSEIEPHVMKAVQSGRLSKANRLATSTANVAPPSQATLESLKRLHPAGAPQPFGNRVGSQCPAVKDDQVIAAIKSTSYDTAGGPSGWSTTLLKTASRNEHFVRFLTKLTNMIANGTAPGQRYLLASFMVPLQSAGSAKIRPIAIGEHFYRIAAKVLARNFRSSGDLAPYQLGVGTAGGVEPIVWKVQKTVEGNENGSFVFLDLANAFNTMDRGHLATALRTHNPRLYRAARWAYGSDSHLLMRSESGRVEPLLLSSQGVRQGDPLGPLFFSYGYRGRLERLALLPALRDADISAYLDDTVVWVPHDPLSPLSAREQAQAVLDAIAADFRDNPADGLSLNLAKCRIHTTADLRESGVQFLGTCVGTDSYRERFLAAKVEEMVVKTRRILRLPKQAAFLLLRQCIAPTLLHLLRCLDSTNLGDQWERATAAVQDAARTLAGVPELDEAARVVATLPVRLGGLGLPDYSFIQPHARAASQDLVAEFEAFLEACGAPPAARDLLFRVNTLRKAHQVRADQLLGTLEDQRRIAMVENASKLGSAWTRMVPIYPTRALGDRQISSALGNRLLLSTEAADQCSSCHQPALFQHGDICGVRRQAPGQARHTAYRDLLARIVREAGSTAVTECAADAPGANPLLRGDLLVVGVNAPDGLAGVLDISFTAPTGLRNTTRSARVERLPDETFGSWTKRQLRSMTALREDDKRRKYRGAFRPPFTPIVFTTGGFQGSAAEKWLKRLRVNAGGKMASVFDLSAALVRARAASLQ